MQTFLFVTVGWIFSVCIHEFGHAFVAYKGGDFTVKEKGYLTLNPIRYTHPVYSFLMPLVFLFLGGIGLPGGAVYINDHLLRSRHWRTGVSLAGPAMNVILLLLLCVPFWLNLIDTTDENMMACALAFLIQLQISAVLFNLIPVPPLDGFQAIAPWLPNDLGHRLLQHSNTFIWILFLLFWYAPPVNDAFWTVVFGICHVLGIDGELAWNGWQNFRFWAQ